jgi:8-oxo-dGTP pyrophosphatase MutT (NUDIX family)
LRTIRRLPSEGPGFLTLERLVVKNLYDGGRTSRPYRFEVVHRRGVDSVGIIPFYFEGARRLMVVFKVGFRPGLYLRKRLRPPLGDRWAYTSVREAVAGSLEPDDRGARGIDARARAELLEETGLEPRARTVVRLGSGFFPSHGQSTEKVHLRAIEIVPQRHARAAGDGSVNEADSGTVVMEAGRILEECRKGRIEDPKLEIGVTRLCHLLRHPVNRRRPHR